MSTVALRRLRSRSPSLALLDAEHRTSHDRPSIYITGFLTPTHQPEYNYAQWLECHDELVRTVGWCEEAFGLEWYTGYDGDWLGRWPVPLHLAALAMVRSSSPSAFAVGVATDALVNAARLASHFRSTRRAAATEAPKLAEALDAFAREREEQGYRIIAHSLGCQLLFETLPMLEPERRPSEVYLCAAAATRSHAENRLQHLCRPGAGKTSLYHFYSNVDEALTTGFLLASGGEPALGTAPLPPSVLAEGGQALRGDEQILCSSHDATPYLGVAAHSAYRTHFGRLAGDAILGRPPPVPRRAAWVVEQRWQLKSAIGRALDRLPTPPPIPLKRILRDYPQAAFGTVVEGVTNRLSSPSKLARRLLRHARRV